MIAALAKNERAARNSYAAKALKVSSGALTSTAEVVIQPSPTEIAYTTETIAVGGGIGFALQS